MTNHRVLARLHARMHTQTHTRHKVHVRFASNTNIDGKHFRPAWSSGNKIATSSWVFSKKCITSQGLVYLSFSSGNSIYTHDADFPCKLFSDSDSVWKGTFGFRIRHTGLLVYLFTRFGCEKPLRSVEEWKTNLMSLVILFHLFCAQHVTDKYISIFRSPRLCWWITTSVVLFSVRCVLEFLLRLIFGGVRFAGWSWS